MTTSDPRIDALARKLADLERTVRSMSGPQLAYSSIEDGAVREYDDQGNLVGQTGRQYDGTHTSSSLGGPPPPRPSTPVAQDAVGGVLIGWDGLYAGGEVSPMDWARIDVAVGLPGFDPIAVPPVGAITSPRGGLLFVKTGQGDYEVALIARSQSGKASTPSSVATVTALEEADPALVAGATQAAADALAASIAAGDTASAASSAAAQAAADAAAASSLATLAKNTADGKITVFRQASAPTTGMSANDLWIDTDDGMLYVRVGTSWVASPDQRIADVVASSATKTTVFYQSSAPSSGGRVTGDLWIDWTNADRVYRWSGSAWVVTTIASEGYVNSRGSLVTNGMGSLRTNRNFTAFGLDLADFPAGAQAANVTTLGASNGRATDEIIPIDPTRKYRIGVSVKNKGVGSTDGYLYFGLWPYDVSNLPMTGDMWMFAAGTTTTLAAPLNVGDTTVTLTSAADWYGQAGKAGIASQRRLVFWDYVDANGKAWPAETYSRNTTASDTWSGTGISGNVITLNAPWAGPAKPAGTKVSNSVSGYTYTYVTPNQVQISVPSSNTWTRIETTYQPGLVVQGPGGTNAGPATGWPPGCTGVKLIVLPNRAASSGVDPNSQHSFGMWYFGEPAAAQADADAANALAALAQTTAAGKITVYRQASAPTGTFTVNDLWIDTDDGLLYAATTTSGGWTLSADQRIAAVVTSNAAKTTVFAQTSQPSTTGRTIGDLWIDTDDGNRLYDWSGSWTARPLGASAIGATARQLGSVTIFRQSTAPTGTFVVGDLWLDSDDGLVYTATTTAGGWTLHSDQRIGAVVASNAVKVTAFAQTSAPSSTGRVLGDIWVDTDDSNKLYVWDGAWTVRLIGAGAINATARQLGAINVYRQGTAPASGMAVNDLWVDSDDGLLYVYTGTWTLSADQRVADLVTSNASKISAFYQTSAPSTTGRALGDLWFDTDDKNAPYIWTGAWTSARDATIGEADAKAQQALNDAAAAASAAAAAGGTANDALTAANGKNAIIHSELAPTSEPNTVGDTWFQHAPADEGGAIVAQFTGLGNGAWAATAISHQVIASIDLGVATVGKLSANYIDTGVLSAALQLTGMLIAGQPTGARVVIDDGGIRQYGSSGDLLINLPTDPDIPSKFEGEVITSSFTSIDRFTMQGLANEISRGATLTVSGGTSSPTTAPSVAYGYATYDPQRWSYLFIPIGITAAADDTPDVLGPLTFLGYGGMIAPGSRRYQFPGRTDDKGGQRSNYGNFSSATAVAVGGASRVVTFGLRTATNGSTPTGSMDSWDWSTMSTDGSTAPAIKAHEDMTANTYVYATYLGRVFGTGSTNLSNRMCIAVRRVLSNDVVLRVYSVSDTGFTRVGSDLVVGDPTDSAQDEGVIGVSYGGSARMGYPGTDQNIWLVHGSKNTYAFSTAGVRLPDYDFPTPPGAAQMTAFGDVVSNAFLGFRTTTTSDKSVITKLTNAHWFSATSSKWWVSSTWYDNDVAGTGTHETAQGPRASITMPKRASLVATIPPYPPRPFPTTTDDPLAARVYVARGNTDPGRANMERAAELNLPGRSTRIGNFAFPSGAAASPPPAAGNFPASSPGKVTSADGTAWVLSGDGKATLSGVEFDGSRPGFVSAAMRAAAFAATDSTNTTSVSTTGAAMGARGGEGTFVAPPSGNILVWVGGQLRSGQAGQYAAIGFEIRTGATIGSGSVFWAYDIDRAVINFLTTNIRAGMGPFFVTGLTPGATYNIRNMIASGTTTASTFAWGRVGVVPCS